MRTSTLVKQHDITDCGAACLASIAGHYGLGMPISRIRQYAGTDRKGTNILGIGKSTFISLLQNLYPLKNGRIRIGDYDIQHLNNESLRRLVSVVPQSMVSYKMPW